MLAAELQPRPGRARGYESGAARPVTMRLRRHGVYARPLGNVVYLMVTPTTDPRQCTRLLETLLQAIEEHCAQETGDLPPQAASAVAA